MPHFLGSTLPIMSTAVVQGLAASGQRRSSVDNLCQSSPLGWPRLSQRYISIWPCSYSILLTSPFLFTSVRPVAEDFPCLFLLTLPYEKNILLPHNNMGKFYKHKWKSHTEKTVWIHLYQVQKTAKANCDGEQSIRYLWGRILMRVAQRSLLSC